MKLNPYTSDEPLNSNPQVKKTLELMAEVKTQDYIRKILDDE